MLTTMHLTMGTTQKVMGRMQVMQPLKKPCLNSPAATNIPFFNPNNLIAYPTLTLPHQVFYSELSYSESLAQTSVENILYQIAIS